MSGAWLAIKLGQVNVSAHHVAGRCSVLDRAAVLDISAATDTGTSRPQGRLTTQISICVSYPGGPPNACTEASAIESMPEYETSALQLCSKGAGSG